MHALVLPAATLGPGRVVACFDAALLVLTGSSCRFAYVARQVELGGCKPHETFIVHVDAQWGDGRDEYVGAQVELVAINQERVVLL